MAMSEETGGAGKAQDYREGFLEGARAMLKAIGDDMAEEQKRVLEKWVEGPLATWRAAGPEATRPGLPAIDGA